jgi:hypothetical protein
MPNCGMSLACIRIAMDPVTCPMCQGAIPGKEIRTARICPGCGADLSALIRQRLGRQLPATHPPPRSTSFIARAALFSLLAPCFSIALYLVGRRALSGSPVEMLMLGAVALLVIAGGFIFGIVAFFAPKGEKATRKAIAGICINGLLISFAILSIFTRQKVATSANNPPEPPRKHWSYLSGK